MYKMKYSDIQSDDQSEARERERIAFDHSIALMERASREDATPVDAAKAIGFTTKLWAVLIEDLIAPHNGLPKELRAQIISIGLWIMREIERIRLEESKDYGDLLAVSRSLRDGLS
jgi:flagellar biosynthesis activator protein FlaF